MNFPEFPGSAFSLALLHSLIGNPEFPGFFRHFPGEGFWGPEIAFSGEDEVDTLGIGGPFLMSQERQGVPARWGDPARDIPTAKPPTLRESHEPGPPLEPGPLSPCPFPKRCRRGGGVPAGRGVPA